MLSGGEQRKISLLRALSIKPKYMVLDEAISGLDIISCDAVLITLEDYKKQYGCAYLFITHDINSAYRIADRILHIEGGHIAVWLKKQKFRRRTMKELKILIAAVISFSLLLTGCATSNTDPETQTSFKSNVDDNNRTLTIGVGVDLDPFIPISQNEYIRSICALPYDTLVKYENGDIVPCLATSWQISDDGKEIIMQLRDDVVFP